jgi:hypothetical protein
MNDQTENGRVVAVKAGQPIRAIVPGTLDEAWRVARYLHAGGFAPKSMNSPHAVMAAILAGLEVGFTPAQSLQAFYVVNGRPMIYGDALVAVVRRSGKMTQHQASGSRAWTTTLTCVVETQREGEPRADPVVLWAHAKRANLASKEGLEAYPKRMLTMSKARNYLLKDTLRRHPARGRSYQ